MDDTICFLDRERSEVHHGLDNLKTELPLPDPKVIYPNVKFFTSMRICSFTSMSD